METSRPTEIVIIKGSWVESTLLKVGKTYEVPGHIAEHLIQKGNAVLASEFAEVQSAEVVTDAPAEAQPESQPEAKPKKAKKKELKENHEPT